MVFYFSALLYSLSVILLRSIHAIANGKISFFLLSPFFCLGSFPFTLLTKFFIVKAVVFPVVMYGCESWPVNKAECQRNWCFQTVVLEKTLQSPLGWKEIKPVYPKRNQPWIFIEGLMLKLKLQYFGPLMQRADSYPEKDPDAGKVWGQKEKGITEDEMVGWYQWLKGHEFEQTQGYSEGQGSLAYWSWWGCKELDTT